MGQIGSALLACWNPPAGSTGALVTLRFSFRRDGSIFGVPRPTGVVYHGQPKARAAFVEAAEDAVRACAPLDLSPALAAGIAGQVFTMTFEGARSREKDRPDAQ
ncbi:hypothetical protein FJU11_15920 [Pararhizobium mangrovi]|uniref:Uncharacterized protein n=2 Tax=Pararhizobium mangrovi TaxID=2590452 RepID=A0A506TYC1_9HYPH|nr:hypothetical protein FJU11_15920 [Pararhizobium mangrovi]